MNDVDPRLSFLAGWWIGRRGRRSGLGCLLIGFGLFVGVSACFSVVAAPVLWMQARSLSDLPQPQVDELAALAPGSRALIVAQLPPDLPTDRYGLALAYVEARSASPSEAGATATTVIAPPPSHVGMVLLDGTPLVVQLPHTPSFLNAQQIDAAEPDGARYVGYQPGQVLTLQGTWEGDNRFTASEFYAGAPDAYLDHLGSAPGATLWLGLLCGGMAVLMVAGGVVLRFFVG